MRLRFYALFIIVFSAFLPSHAQIDFSTGAEYSYTKGVSSSTVASDWFMPTSSGGGWSTGHSPFWFGDGQEGVGTQMSDIQNGYLSFFLRSTFTAENVESLKDLNFMVNYDDGFVIYVNGHEVLSQNAPEDRSYNSPAAANHESGTFEPFTVSKEACYLQEGLNHVAVQVFNISYTSSDVYFDLGINAAVKPPVLPNSPKVKVNYEAGFYDVPFTLEMRSSDSTSQIRYTLDASDPRYSTTAVLVDSIASIRIDPSSPIGRPVTPGVVLRACAYQEGYEGGVVKTRTFIFPSEVERQASPSGPWPTAEINGQVLNFTVNNDILNDARYKDKIVESLLDISTFSIVTEAGNLFDSSTGIYVNALNSGREWERPCSIELMDKDTAKGFQENAGLRIRGGYSRNDNFPKHSFRFYFRDEYGSKKLNYPLFEEEGAEEFDKMDLRTAQNHSWTKGSTHNTFVREVFSRDLQGDMGWPYTRSRYYHLYVNGLYFGLYQTQERSESSFAQSYMGGETEDYDVVKGSRVDGDLQSVLLDGSDASWQSIYDMLSLDLTKNKNYFKFLGCDAEGVRDLSLPVLVDVENLIDYMMIIFYTGNYDSPVSAFRSNKKPNNYYAIDNRENPLEGFQFFAHDCEHSLFSEGVSPGIGLYEDRVNLTTRTDGKDMQVSEYNCFHPQWLHAKLSANEEYLSRFSNRAFWHFSETGVLSQQANSVRLNRRVQEISKAMLGESLRWGSYKVSPALNPLDHWSPEVSNILTDYFPYRASIVINQLEKADLYPILLPPSFEIKGAEVKEEKYHFEGSVDLSMNSSSGDIIYTLNGKDPRAVGGVILSSAFRAASSVDITVSSVVVVKARVYNGTEWSPCRELYLSPEGNNLSYLKVTELHYHPLDSIKGTDTISDSNFEFIEFKNTHLTKSLNLGGLHFDSGIDYTFPANFILGPQEFYVLASNTYKFYSRYGHVPSGQYLKQLSNGGEMIRLLYSNDSLHTAIYYEDRGEWSPKADGRGRSLVSYEANPVTYLPARAIYWLSSADIGGSPFADDVSSQSNVLDVERVYQHKTLALRLVPNPTRGGVKVSIDGLHAGQLLNVEICSLTGHVLLSRQQSNHSYLALDSHLLYEGVFIVRVKVEGQYYVEKLVYRP